MEAHSHANHGGEIVSTLTDGQLLETYDAGHLNDFGGGNVGWWHDYMRAELERAHEFYAEQLEAMQMPPLAATPCMKQAAEKYWSERRFRRLSDGTRNWAGVYAVMVAAYAGGI